MLMPPTPTVVHLLDDPESSGGASHKVKRVLINGTQVLVEADSLDIKFGAHQTTTVSLSLIVGEVHFQ